MAASKPLRGAQRRGAIGEVGRFERGVEPTGFVGDGVWRHQQDQPLAGAWRQDLEAIAAAAHERRPTPHEEGHV